MPATTSSDGLPHDPKAVREERQRIDLVARKRADENKAEIDQVAADAFVMGRNMFGPGRGEWDLSWTGWWGDNPPYHAPVFVLTHHSREPLAMEGGTTFTFVTDGIESALDQARKAAGDRDVAIAGGAATVNQYLAAGLIDEIHTHIAPVTIGRRPGRGRRDRMRHHGRLPSASRPGCPATSAQPCSTRPARHSSRGCSSP